VSEWDSEWYYHFRLDDTYKNIEWCELKPGENENAARLEEITCISRKIGFEIEIGDGIVRLIGYRWT
jgi:hypothetical protein